MIENYAGIIESILRDELDQVDADIDLASFNSYSKIISSFTGSGFINNEIESKEWLTYFLADSKAFLFAANSGEFKADAIKSTYSDTDVAMSIDFNEFTSLEFPRTEPSQVISNIMAKHSWSGSTFRGATAETSDSTVQTRYNITSKQTTLNHESKTTRKSATALLIRDWLLDFWKQPHNLLVGTLPKVFLRLEIGDIIKIKNMQYKVRGENIATNATRAGQTIYPYWKIINVSRGNELDLIAVQLHELS